LAPWNPLAAKRVMEAARAANPDVVHIHNTWIALSPAAFRSVHAAGYPTLFTHHNYRSMCVAANLLRDGRPCQDCVGTHPWRGLLYRCHGGSVFGSAVAASTVALARARNVWDRDVDLHLALTDFARDRFLADGLAPEQITVKPNFSPDPGSRPHLPAASDTIVCVGRLATEKGVDLLLDAWDPTLGLRLEIVGTGPLEQSLRARTPPQVTFLGHLSPPPVTQRMLEARALVLPVRGYESFPMVLLEAFAAGLPVICSDVVAATPTTVGYVGSEWTFPAGDAASLRSLLHRVAEDAAWVDLGGQRARARYLEAFTPAKNLAQLESAYGNAIARHKAHSQQH